MRTFGLPFPVAAALAAAAAFGAWPGEARAAEGHWRMHAIRRSTPEKLTKPFGGGTLGHRTSADPTPRGLITKYDYVDPNGRTVDTFHIHWTWSPIPVVLVPGEKVPLTYGGTVVAYPTWAHGHVGFTGPLIRGEFWRSSGKDRWERQGAFLDAKNNGMVQFKSGGKAAEKPKSAELRTTATVPSGRTDGELALNVEIDAPKWWTYSYVYTWVAAPAPAKRPDPIRAGQEQMPDGGTGAVTGTGSAPGSGTGAGPGTGTGAGPGTGTGTSVEISGLALRAGQRSVKPGGSVTVPLWLLKASRIGNLNVEVRYDPAVVRIEGKATKGNLIGDALFDTNPGEAGKLYVGLATPRGLDGDGTIAQMTFRAVGKAGQRSPLTLRVTEINTTADAVPKIGLIHGGIEIRETGKDGDADGDGRITLADAMLALQMSIKLIPEKRACDVDRSGSVTSRDARLLIDKAWEGRK
jgi:hypothetical protein